MYKKIALLSLTAYASLSFCDTEKGEPTDFVSRKKNTTLIDRIRKSVATNPIASICATVAACTAFYYLDMPSVIAALVISKSQSANPAPAQDNPRQTQGITETQSPALSTTHLANQPVVTPPGQGSTDQTQDATETQTTGPAPAQESLVKGTQDAMENQPPAPAPGKTTQQ